MTTYQESEIRSEAAIYAQDTWFSTDELVQAWNTFRSEGERLQDFYERYLSENSEVKDDDFQQIKRELSRLGWSQGPCGCDAELLPNDMVKLHFETVSPACGPLKELLRVLRALPDTADMGEGLDEFWRDADEASLDIDS